MYAIIETGGKQFRVKEGDVIEVEKLDAQPGETISITKVLMVGNGDDVTFGSPLVEGAVVEVEVEDTYRGKKLLILKFKKRKKYRRKQGHRQSITKIAIKSIKTV